MSTITNAAQRAIEVRKGVYSLLEKYPATRDDDRQLMLRYWSEIDGIQYDFTFPQYFVEKATSPESISRARRSIQAEGLFPPTIQKVIERRSRQAELREHYGH